MLCFRSLKVFSNNPVPFSGIAMEMTKTAPTPSTSLMTALTAMFYEPTRAFSMLEARPRAWFPLLVTILASCALMLYYSSVVDFPWMMEQMMSAVKGVSAEDMQKHAMSKGMFTGMSIASVIVVSPLFVALTGAYLMLMAKLLTKDFSFGKGFALSAWSSVPNLLAVLAGMVMLMLSSNGRVTAQQLNPLSLNQLFFQYAPGHPMATLLDSLSVPVFWSMALSVIGFQVWAKVSRATAMKVVLIPYLTIFGLWFVYAMSKAA
jgi:hypothetical protein